MQQPSPKGNRGDILRTALYVSLICVGWLTAQVVALWFAKIVFTTVSSRDFLGFFIVTSAAAFVGIVLVIFRKRRNNAA